MDFVTPSNAVTSQPVADQTNGTRCGMKALHLLLALLLACGGAASARAMALPDGGVTAAEVTAILQQRGYPATSSTDQVGDPLLKSTSKGVNFSVYFYTCNKSPRCTSIQFYAGFKKPGISASQIGEWNRTTRFGKAYLDKDGDPNVEMDMDVEHGATTEAIANDLDRWIAVLGAFTKKIGW
jgi:hypothetical protein